MFESRVRVPEDNVSLLEECTAQVQQRMAKSNWFKLFADNAHAYCIKHGGWQ